jgi:two-component system, cell cycle sensor histidine kinase and response regulator CckA
MKRVALRGFAVSLDATLHLALHVPYREAPRIAVVTRNLDNEDRETAATNTDTRARKTSAVPRQTTILIAEDQAAIRMLAEEVLTEAGHKVLSAPNGRLALELAAAYAGEIDLVVTDVMMPELNGPDLVSELSKSRPGARVLYMSGCVGGAIDPRAARNGHSAFLAKPFPPGALRDKVRTLLSNGAKAPTGT